MATVLKKKKILPGDLKREKRTANSPEAIVLNVVNLFVSFFLMFQLLNNNDNNQISDGMAFTT